MPFNQPCPSHAAANRAVEPATGLSYRDTDLSAAGPNFHPLIQQKRLVTGQRKGDVPQAVSAGRERCMQSGHWQATSGCSCASRCPDL